MDFVRKFTTIALVITIVLVIWAVWHKPQLPATDYIQDEIVTQMPKQEKMEEKPFTTTLKDYTYTIYPLFSYEQYGLVVSQHAGDSFLNIYHEQDPGNVKDICVVWGENISGGAYKKVQYKSGEFTCSYRYNTSLNPPFLPNALANNHVIPANEQIAKTIKQIGIGDQIHIKGYLANYSVADKNGAQIFTRNTSTTREDTGNGACEIIFVTDIEILRAANHIDDTIQKYAGFGALGSLVLLAGTILL